MKDHEQDKQFGCGCDCGCDRRDFLAAAGVAAGGLTFAALKAGAAELTDAPVKKQGAKVRVAFVYPPSERFAGPDGWWSWPGNDFDAEGRQKQYTAELRKMEKKLGLNLAIDDKPVARDSDAKTLAKQLKANPPDGLVVVLFYHNSMGRVHKLLRAAEMAGVPVVFYIALGAKHMPIDKYRRPGIYFIQSLDNFEAIEYGLRMINAKKQMSQSTLLSIVEAKEPQEGTEPFFGTKIRVVPFARYADEFHKVKIDNAARKFIAQHAGGAKEIRGVTQESLENAARAHFALKRLLAQEQADGVAMKCLKRGMLKPCMSFAALNGELVPAACQNDFNSVLIMLLGKYLFARPGFIHNLCYDTEHNTFYASHCTCPTKVYGPEGPELPYLLRRFAHSNEGSCAIQVFWKEGDPVTAVEYYPDKASKLKARPGPGTMWMTSAEGDAPVLDVYSGKVVKSHPMPPAAGCTTNVEVEITDRTDACKVFGGHAHNVLFCGDFARKFRLFTQLHKMQLADTGFSGHWPG